MTQEISQEAARELLRAARVALKALTLPAAVVSRSSVVEARARVEAKRVLRRAIARVTGEVLP